MCHGQAMNPIPLQMESCPGCAAWTMLYEVRARRNGESFTGRACLACVRLIAENKGLNTMTAKKES